MSEAAISNGRKTHHSSSWGLINNYRYLTRKTMVQRAVENAKARKKRQRKNNIANLKRKRIEHDSEKVDSTETLKKRKLCPGNTSKDIETSTQNSLDAWAHVSKFELQLSCPVEASLTSGVKESKLVTNHLNLVSEKRVPAAATLVEGWEVDSGFSSETSPPASGRGSPCPGLSPGMVVAMDCEMVGTGPGGRCSELARCSLLDYQGNVIYDKYIRPCQPVTDYRTRWSGIRKHHLQNALPFYQARREILGILKGKVVVGHALFNDFQALDFNHPGHMVRDTSSTRLLRRLAGFPVKRCISLKILANKLLDRKIQVGRRGHCSVEDARAALDLYKLVEGEWEQDLREMMEDTDPPALPDPTASSHYMQDKYWPENLASDGQ